MARCRELAKISDISDGTLRTFLSPAMRRCYDQVSVWMREAGMEVSVDHAGNLRGKCGHASGARPLLMGSHLDTVRNAGAFDGVLGVMLAIELAEMAVSNGLTFPIQVVGFSEEEGVRFGKPFIGSRAIAGSLEREMLSLQDDDGVTVAEAIRSFGLDPTLAGSSEIHPRPFAFLEFHIEQGPVLDHFKESLAVVDAIVGQTRAVLRFTGQANHAGTTPQRLRRDALCAAAEWITCVEQVAISSQGLVATVGKVSVIPGVANAVPGEVTLSLDCRHGSDEKREAAVAKLRAEASVVAARRNIDWHWSETLNQDATPMNIELVRMLEAAATECGFEARRMASGAGHDAMIMAPMMPSAMLFLRSPGGISHHPDESVLLEDLENALAVGDRFIANLSASAEWKMA